MVNKFHYLALFVWCVFLSCISASGDAVMCEMQTLGKNSVSCMEYYCGFKTSPTLTRSSAEVH